MAVYAAKMHSLNIYIQMFGYLLQSFPAAVRVARQLYHMFKQ